MTYLDNAATSFPKPATVAAKMAESLRLYSANAGRGGHSLSMRAAEEIHWVREKAAGFFGLNGPERCVFTANATMSLNMTIKGLLRRGDHFLISELEHNAVLRPAHAMSFHGCRYDVFRVFPQDDEKTIKGIKSLLRPNTRAIIFTMASNVTGQLLPSARICEFAAEAGIITVVDASQAAGHIDIKHCRIPFDFLCTSGHKGLCGPQGTGLLMLGGDVRLETLLEGGTGTSSLSLSQPEDLPERLESGTLNLHGIVGLGAGIDYVTENFEEINRRETALIGWLCEKLEELPGIKLYGDGRGAPLLSFTADGWAGADIEAALDARGICVRSGLHCAPMAHRTIGTIEGGTVRVSAGAFNTAADAALFVHSLSEILLKH